MAKKLYIALPFLIFAFSFVFAQYVHVEDVYAQPAEDVLGLDYAAESGLSAEDPRILIARIINVSLGLLGIIAVVLVLAAGFRWMTAGGNEEKVTSARKILISAVIGLIIILSAYAISHFVLTNLYDATRPAAPHFPAL